MRMAVLIACACVACAQDANQQRVFSLTAAPSPRALQELVNTFRTMLSTPRVEMTAAGAAVTGAPAQLDLAGWLTSELDVQPGGGAPKTSEYQVSGERDPSVVVFHVANAGEPPDLQGYVNVVRSIANLTRVFPFYQARAISARGTPGEIAVTKWLMASLDLTPGLQGGRAPAEYTTDLDEGKFSAGRQVRVFYLQHTGAAAGVQEIVNSLRTIGDITRVFPLMTGAHSALVARGDAAQIAAAEWLVQELDRAPAAAQGSVAAKQVALDSGTEARVFHLAHVHTPEDIQKVVAEIRATAHVQRVFGLAATQSVVLRGTAAQAAQAEAIVAAWDK